MSAPISLRKVAEGMYAKGYRFLVFIEDRERFAATHFFAKTAEQVGPVLREDFPTFKTTSVWQLEKLFGKGVDNIERTS